MRRTSAVLMLLALLVPFATYAQRSNVGSRSRAGTLEGVVEETLDWPRTIWIIVDSGGSKYQLLLWSGDDDATVIGEDVRRVGTPIKVTYSGLSRRSDGIYEGKAVRVVNLSGSLISYSDLKREINELRQAMLKKIDDDIESIALGFANSEAILRDLRVAYTAKTVLDTFSGSFGIISGALDVRKLKASAIAVESPIQFAGLMVAVHGAVENGERLAFVFDKNRYSTDVSRMLETAESTHPRFRFDSFRYKNSIKQSLDGTDSTSMILMPHRFHLLRCSYPVSGMLRRGCFGVRHGSIWSRSVHTKVSVLLA